MDYAERCRLATEDQGLAAFAAAEGWTVEQTGGMIMVAVRYNADGTVWTVTLNGTEEDRPYFAVRSTREAWEEGLDTGDLQTLDVTLAEALALGDPRLPVGTRVRAIYPNARWGEGTIVSDIDDPGLKPYVVKRDGDGQVGYFHADQIEALTVGAEEDERQADRELADMAASEAAEDAETITRYCVSCGTAITVHAESDAAWGEVQCENCESRRAPTIAEVNSAIAAADVAFWATIADHLPTITTGDFGPDSSAAWDAAMRRAVGRWVADNARGLTDDARDALYDAIQRD